MCVCLCACTCLRVCTYHTIVLSDSVELSLGGSRHGWHIFVHGIVLQPELFLQILDRLARCVAQRACQIHL